MSKDHSELSRRRRGLLTGLGGIVTAGVLSNITGQQSGSNTAVSTSAAVAVAATESDGPPIEWIRRYDGQDNQETTTTPRRERTGLMSVVTTDDGGYALGGYYTPPDAARDAMLLKTDGEGKRQWVKTYGGSDVDEVESVLQTSDGGYLLAGEHGNPAGEQNTATGPRSTGWVIKTDRKGNVEWTTKPDETSYSHLRDATQTRDGGYALAGWVQEHDDLRGWVVKLNRTGRPIIDKRYDSTNDNPAAVEEQFWAVTETGHGGLVFAGEDSDGAWILGTTPAGKKQWETVLKHPHGAAHDVVETADGHVLLTGRLFGRDEETEFTMTDDRNPSDLYLTLLDEEGNEQWTKAYDGGANEQGQAVVRTADEGFAAVGGSLGPSDDVFLVKTEHDGAAQWSETYLEDRSRTGADLIQSPDGGFAVAVSHSDVFFKTAPASSIRMTDRSFEVHNRECGNGENKASVESGNHKVVIDGIIDGQNRCYTADLERARYDDDADELIVAVQSYESNDGGTCAQCIVDIDYRATFEFEGGTPGEVTVQHNGEPVTS